jgi:hypothetical protein
VFEDVSINRKDKAGAIAFEHFDKFEVGYSFEGSDIWKNAQGRAYIFAPKPKYQPKKAWTGGGKTAAVEKAMDRKEASIETFQERKEESIKLAGAMRDATQITLAALREQSFPSDDEFKAEWTKWAKWLLSQADQPFI